MCTNHRNPLHCILPPHVLAHIAKNGNSLGARSAAVDTLVHDAHQRSMRLLQSAVSTSATRLAQTLRAGINPLGPQITVMDGNSQEVTSGPILRTANSGPSDDQDAEQSLDRFADIAIGAGSDALIVHARKAWLEGLSPRENRNVPPLDHARVHRLKRRLGNYPVILNGGIMSIAEVKAHLAHVDGVMMGRGAYENPGQLLAADPEIFGKPQPAADLKAALEKLFPYIERAIADGTRLNSITRHLLGLFRGQPGARLFRRHLATEAVKPGAGVKVLREALSFVQDGELARSAA